MSSISHRIGEAIRYKGISIRSFESQAGITQGVLSNAIKKDSDISSTNLSKIIDTYDEFDAHWLLTGEGEMLRSPEPKKKDEINADTFPEEHTLDCELDLPHTEEFEYVNNDNEGKIPVVHELSFALLDPDEPGKIKADEYYYIKEFRNADFLMRLNGDYMSPKYKSGDLIACRNVKYSNFYQWGRIYALLTCHQGVVVGRVYPHVNNVFIEVQPSNPDYPRWRIPNDEIAMVAIVVGAISLD